VTNASSINVFHDWLVFGLMADQCEALADTTQLIDTIYFGHTAHCSSLTYIILFIFLLMNKLITFYLLTISFFIFCLSLSFIFSNFKGTFSVQTSYICQLSLPVRTTVCSLILPSSTAQHSHGWLLRLNAKSGQESAPNHNKLRVRLLFHNEFIVSWKWSKNLCWVGGWVVCINFTHPTECHNLQFASS
jgi:hypothetical protein